MLSILFWWFKFYLLLIVSCSAIAIIESVLHFRTGARKLYIRLLLWLFEWGHQRLGKKGFDPYEAAQMKRVPHPTSSRDLIRPEASRSLLEKLNLRMTDQGVITPLSTTRKLSRGKFFTVADDLLDWTRWGMEVIVTDDVLLSFHAQELSSWNLLTRTDRGYTFVSLRLTVAWIVGACFRYIFLFPVRLFILLFGFAFMFLGILLVGFCLPSVLRRFFAPRFTLITVRILSRAISLSVRSHNTENKPRPGGICVANHTSPIDFIVLGMDNYFSAIGQRFPGFPGFLQGAMRRLAPHIWFNRFQRSDRDNVKQFLIAHTKANKPPVLLFPEGVCVNNTAVLEFKKGSFEVGATMYPVAIVYDRRLGEPYWFQEHWYQHLIGMMTGWSILCDIYYLPPVRIEEHETSHEFAQRVKTEIALKGGLLDVQWDGMVRYKPVRSDLIDKVKALYSERLARFRWISESSEKGASVTDSGLDDSISSVHN